MSIVPRVDPASSPIHAIETAYAGCRFRSRLEARWAVFFDCLGLKWEYEPEGFELPGGVRYLPDFSLLPAQGAPWRSLWVEIKPRAIETTCTNVYLAGKVARGDWRHSLVPDLRRVRQVQQHPNPLAFKSRSDLRYVGPYFAGDDHGCAHGVAQHGAIAGYCSSEETTESDVLTSCVRGILSADVVFAWIDSTDCYGTLVEIGYAAGVGKRCIVAFDERLIEELPQGGDFHNAVTRHDMWFVGAVADESTKGPDPIHAFNAVFPSADSDLDIALRKIEAIAQGNPHFLLSGPPGDQIVFGSGKSVASLLAAAGYDGDPPSIRDAINAARSSRFEFGETPSSPHDR